jgi:protein-tyrosine phosphatase
VFVDVHSHVVPAADDGAQSAVEALELCRVAAAHGTAILFATPHVWPGLELTPERERAIRAAHAELVPAAAAAGLDLRLGFELTPSRRLLEEEPARYRLGGLDAVLMELPFSGGLDLAERLAEHIEAAGLTPVIAHPERVEAVHADPVATRAFAERWPLQVNGSSLLGRHGNASLEIAWELVESGQAALVGSDGHRATRPARLDEAYEAVRARVGEEHALPLFAGAALEPAGLAARDGLDVAERREAV